MAVAKNEQVQKSPKPTNPPKPEVKAGDVPIEEAVDYKLTHTDVVMRTKDGALIPNDPNNPDRVAYEAWGMAGGVAIPADPIPGAAPVEPVAEPKAATTNKEHKHSA